MSNYYQAEIVHITGFTDLIASTQDVGIIGLYIYIYIYII